ncbi:probable G-protein coupled receptor Mth-like 14 isoform X4 [Stomoxys calcitrans]|uniref:probable G-protein coupled receptor Mth-like 14 isoform X4 n=1 Tax=Stomoxys calcitrans TaxID=35570 RepID=UPI0027E289CE|nr:probable G-protein coupled receptor Mth-like 14 isoform X4 [Stomoxys calcitrans]
MTHKIGTLFLLLLLLSLCTAGELESKKDLTTLTNVKTENEYIKSSTNQFPENCSQREKCKTQPINTRNSHLRKCCPIGESLSIAHDDQNRAMCVSTSRNVNIKVINVTLYDNCIEDMESELSLPLEIGNPCNTIHISLNKPKTQLITYLYMGSYCSVSFIGSSILVILTYQKGLPGMPSYFIQGYTESIRESQRYFIPPVSTLLLLSFFVMAGSFFGFQKLKRRGIPLASKQDVDISPLCNITVYEEVKKDAKCISLLGLILISTWLLEIVTFYSPGPQIYLILMDMVNGVQGVFVLLIFLIIRRRRRIIFRWWSDRGSLVLEKLELEAFN